MSADGVFTVTSPTYPGENVANAFDEIKENFEYIRRFMMFGCEPPITGVTISYTYTGGKLTAITFGGTLAGSAAFSYTGDDLTQEVWSIYSKTITHSHSYSLGILQSTTITVA